MYIYGKNTIMIAITVGIELKKVIRVKTLHFKRKIMFRSLD
jgi:hypothetical protein